MWTHLTNRLSGHLAGYPVTLHITNTSPDASEDGQRIPITRATPLPPCPDIDARLRATILAARFHGTELDPGEFRAGPGEVVPGAAAFGLGASGGPLGAGGAAALAPFDAA